MRVTLPVIRDSRLDNLFQGFRAAIEHAFERVKEYAVVPQGGAAGSVLVKADARTYNLSWEARADTAANIASAAAAINTTGKYQGRTVYDTTNHRLMVADGALSTSLWYVADGSASVTPA